MSDRGPFGPGGPGSGPGGPEGDDPFAAIPFLGDLARMLQQQGPVSWDAARQLAWSIATGGASEPNVDPLARMQFEQLARVAELQVTSTTGLAAGRGGGIQIVPVTRAVWVQRSLDAHRELLEALAGALAATPGAAGPAAASASGGLTDEPSEPGAEAMEAMLGGLLRMLGPMMLGMTAGSMVGHLAKRSFGQYDLPIPRHGGDEVMVALANVDAFGDEWSLPRDDLRLWVCVHEVAHHTVLGVPHIRQRLSDLLRGYVSGFRADPGALENRLGQIDPSDTASLTALQDALGDPETLLGAMRSPEQAAIVPHLDALVAVVVGYVDWVMDRVGTGLIGSYGMVTEAMRRRRVTADPSDRFVEKLLGLELTQPAYERGSSFIEGVAERAGPEALERLWRSERELPTPNEVNAPGLWLARIDLPD